ncbi:hypothetical protein [Streptomyces sp. B22F1]|uniref:hypothetical protein n=1 Tax=Streptomyces sp. B22F1 TaxID=3153566 RepID=UPI00325DE305
MIELTGDPDRVLTVSDFAAAAELGVRITTEIRYDQMKEFARLAGEGILVVPVARTYASTGSRKRPSSANPAAPAANSCSSCDHLAGLVSRKGPTQPDDHTVTAPVPRPRSLQDGEVTLEC